MSTIELEAGKAAFVREFLNETNEDLVTDLLKFASKNRVINRGYKFDRDECYDR